MKKEFFLDIGELGWSLYLSAHIRWLKDQENMTAAVMTYPDRECLFRNVADRVLNLPSYFYERFNTEMQGCAKIKRVAKGIFREFFLNYNPDGYNLRSDLLWVDFSYFKGKAIYKSYPVSTIIEPRPQRPKEILIFPRARRAPGYKNRNLPSDFYRDLIYALCREFNNRIVRSIGVPKGAWSIFCPYPNYINSVHPKNTIQGIIDFCDNAIAAVGAQSAPPKLALLQGVPTFMIGHQKGRHTVGENWMKTAAGFFEIDKKEYSRFNNPDCIKQVISFIKEHHG